VRVALGALGADGVIVSPLDLEAVRALRAARTPAEAPVAAPDASEPGVAEAVPEGVAE
jgi:hypothetical protein